MRDFSQIRARFWTGRTGRALRSNRDAQVLALYLMTCQSANMIGLYYLAFPTLLHETGLTDEEAMGGFEALEAEDFARYRRDDETVWVINMLREQVGETIKPGDKRLTGVLREAEQEKRSVLYPAFFAHYQGAYKALPSPLQAPSKGDFQDEKGDPSETETELNRTHTSPASVPAHARNSAHPPADLSEPAPAQRPQPRKCDRAKSERAWNRHTKAIAVSGLGRVEELCEAAAAADGSPYPDPDQYLAVAIEKFTKYAASCTPGRQPSLSPVKFEEHWVRIQRLVAGHEQLPEGASATPDRDESRRLLDERANKPHNPPPPEYRSPSRKATP